MNRSDLIKNLAVRFPHLMACDAEFAVGVILEGIGQALARGDRPKAATSADSVMP